MQNSNWLTQDCDGMSVRAKNIYSFQLGYALKKLISFKPMGNKQMLSACS